MPLRSGATIQVIDDPYSDRIRCEHPMTHDGAHLGHTLLQMADRRQRGRVTARVMPSARPGLEMMGFRTEGIIPGYFRGELDCAVMGAYVDDERGALAHPKEAATVRELLDPTQLESRPGRAHPPAETRRAAPADAPALAEILGDTFEAYPTPSDRSEYLAKAIEEGTPFRVVEREGQIAACASADLVRSARTAELTDCATRPEHRGHGLMKSLLSDLMDDLRELDYPTAFTLARARNPGVNLAFARLGFEYRGTMPSSCRISTGIEDMNILSRHL